MTNTDIAVARNHVSFRLKKGIPRAFQTHLVCQALAKLANIAWQTLLFVSESLAMDKKVTPDLRWKQQCLASNVSHFRQGFKASQLAKQHI